MTISNSKFSPEDLSQEPLTVSPRRSGKMFLSREMARLASMNGAEAWIVGKHLTDIYKNGELDRSELTATIFKSPLTAWVAVIDADGYTLGLATLNEPGYAPMKEPSRFDSFETAQEAAEAINESQGIDAETAQLVHISSMREQLNR